MPLKSDKKQRIGFIGAGVVGTALAMRLKSSGYPVSAISDVSTGAASRFAERVKGSTIYGSNQDVVDNSTLVFITTPDSSISGVVLALKWDKGKYVIHCSGANSTDILEHARESGALVGSFHPLQTFASIEKAIENIPGSTFALEAEEPLLSILKHMVKDLNGSWILLTPEDKVAYHAAAVFVSNYLVTLVKIGSDLWQTFNVSPDRAVKAMMPLIRGTLNNIASVGIPACLTGPIARGDTVTVEKHVDNIEKLLPGMVSTYRELGRQTIPIALAKGTINDLKAEELKKVLTSPVNTGNGGRQCV